MKNENENENADGNGNGNGDGNGDGDGDLYIKKAHKTATSPTHHPVFSDQKSVFSTYIHS